jgi:hypothetical protein
MLLFTFTLCSNSFFTLSVQLILPIVLQVHILSLTMYFNPHSRNLTLLCKQFTKGDMNTRSWINSDKKLSRLKYQFRKEAIQIRKAIHKINTAYFWSSYFILNKLYLKNSINYFEHFGTRSGLVVEALQYKPEGHGIDSRWCHWNFLLM